MPILESRSDWPHGNLNNALVRIGESRICLPAKGVTLPSSHLVSFPREIQKLSPLREKPPSATDGERFNWRAGPHRTVSAAQEKPDLPLKRSAGVLRTMTDPSLFRPISGSCWQRRCRPRRHPRSPPRSSSSRSSNRHRWRRPPRNPRRRDWQWACLPR